MVAVGGRQMPEYRAYLTGWDGHISRRVDLICEDDEAASARAEQLVDGHDVELWEHARLVAKFTTKDDTRSR